MHVEVVGDLAVILFKNRMNCADVWFGRSSEITVPVAMSSAANKSMVPLRL
jgi:hypothetical protein